MSNIYRRTRNNSEGTYYTPCSADQKRRVLKRLQARERARTCTGPEAALVMTHKHHPPWELWRRRTRIADLDGRVREVTAYTLLSPENVKRLRRVKRRPSAVQPMRPGGAK